MQWVRCPARAGGTSAGTRHAREGAVLPRLSRQEQHRPPQRIRTCRVTTAMAAAAAAVAARPPGTR
eukprot:10847660-Alexandrium_andersonii.AAC.1